MLKDALPVKVVEIQNVVNMEKVKEKDILKKGATLKSHDYDFSSPEFAKRICKVKEKQDKLRKSTKINIEDLRKIVITI